ncbi:hypothetical protein PRZ48_012756 [Zasmidium cellare]|uniref:Uncharacterized protein n=1 Tax=Zasmidium cellare TaxID=395010 RepID=A0ABR0E5R5_ZASCE|nr:hypothetical protein PRZ48_012756 [Zasmidium cellare]
MTGQLPGVQWRHVQTRGIDVDNQDLPFAYFIAVCELWRTFDTIIDRIYTPAFDTLSADAKRDLHASCQAQLRAFHTASTPRILIPRSSSCQYTAPEVLYFHIAYHTAILLLDRPFLIDPTAGINANALSSIKTSASTICKTLQAIHKHLSWSEIPAALIFHIVRVNIGISYLPAPGGGESQNLPAGAGGLW